MKGPKIVINDKYSIRRTDACWELYESYNKVSRATGKVLVGEKVTYHKDIGQVCSAILDREAGKCLSVAELRDLFDLATELLSKQLRKVVEGGEG